MDEYIKQNKILPYYLTQQDSQNFKMVQNLDDLADLVDEPNFKNKVNLIIDEWSEEEMLGYLQYKERHRDMCEHPIHSYPLMVRFR